MKTLKGLLSILRIPEQTIYIVPYFFGILASGYRNYQVVYIVAFGLLLLGLAAFSTNEYIDSFDTDTQNKRKHPAIDFKKNTVPIAVILFLLTIFGSAIFYYYQLTGQLLLLYLFGYFHSLPPLRFKGRFPWDMIAPFISAGLVPYSIGFALNGSSYATMFTAGFAVLACIGFCFQGVHEIVDLDADKQSGLTTWATVLGYRNYLRIIEKVAILGLLTSGYIIYRHESWWLYPALIILIYQTLVIGYARAAIYQPGRERLHSIGRRALPVSVRLLSLILIFQIWALYQPTAYLPWPIQ